MTLGVGYAIAFSRWQHPAVWREVRLAGVTSFLKPRSQVRRFTRRCPSVYRLRNVGLHIIYAVFSKKTNQFRARPMVSIDNQ